MRSAPIGGLILTFDCTLDCADFDCPDAGTFAADAGDGFDAQLSGEAEAFGTFTSSKNAAGEQSATVTCSGADCDLAESALGVTFPCQYRADFVIDFVRVQ